MSTAEAIYEKAKSLPEDRRVEALRYLDFLLAGERAKHEAMHWAQFSSREMSKQYAPEDSIYDQD